jgi:polysaccharide biosynthesis/export protein
MQRRIRYQIQPEYGFMLRTAQTLGRGVTHRLMTQGLVLASLLGTALLVSGCGASLTADQATTELTAQQKIGAQTLETPLVPGAISKPARNADATPLAKQVDALAAVATPGSTAYKIGPLDVLEITVFKVPELSKTVQVADSGSVGFPLVGDVAAAGRTAQDVERDLTAKLGAKYLKSPQVSVFVKEFNSQRITVEGAVKKPGVHPIRGKLTLLQAIALSEGIDTNVASNIVVVFRTTDGKRSAARFDIDAVRGGAALDPDLRQGDLIIVDNSTSKQMFNNFVKLLPLASVFVGVL